MTEQHFTTFLEFFQSHVRASVDMPVLLILDNHGSYLSIAEDKNTEKINSLERNENVSISESTSCSDLSNVFQGIRPFPKAAPRKQYNRERKRRASCILTDSPKRKKLAFEKKSQRKKVSKSQTMPKRRGRPPKEKS